MGEAKTDELISDAECIAWSLPLGQEAPRSKARWIKVNLLALCSPGTTIFESSGYDRTSGTSLPYLPTLPSSQIVAVASRVNIHQLTGTHSGQ